jgi:hypothetical protein
MRAFTPSVRHSAASNFTARGPGRHRDNVIFSDDQSCCRLLQPATSRILKCLELLLHCAKLVATRLNPPHSTTRVSVTHLLPNLDYPSLELCGLNVQCLNRTRPNASDNVPAPSEGSSIMIS